MSALRAWALVVGVSLGSSALAGELEQIRAATVTLAPGRCAGVLVSSGADTRLVTAAHCLFDDEHSLAVDLPDGRSTGASLLAIDRATDVAVLSVDVPLSTPTLGVARAPVAPGAGLLFAGRNDRAPPLQHATLARLGRCPSLPAVPDALFTTVQALPGDSGAPLVNERLEVVGLVHGGAACHIATPAREILPVLARAEAQALTCQPTDSAVGGSGPGAPH